MEIKLHHGDCLEKMKDIPDKSVDLTVTSPPYDNLRTYNDTVTWNFEIFKEIAKEIVRNDATDRVLIGLDFFDASINRISAWVVGMRNMQKALLNALLTPNALLKKLQDEGRFSEKMALSEEIKTLPFGDVWKKFCLDNGVIADESWFKVVEEYENEVLLKRN